MSPPSKLEPSGEASQRPSPDAASPSLPELELELASRPVAPEPARPAPAAPVQAPTGLGMRFDDDDDGALPLDVVPPTATEAAHAKATSQPKPADEPPPIRTAPPRLPEIREAAQFGSPPDDFVGCALYVLRVRKRRRELQAELVQLAPTVELAPDNPTRNARARRVELLQHAIASVDEQSFTRGTIVLALAAFAAFVLVAAIAGTALRTWIAGSRPG